MGQYNKAVLTTAGEKLIARALAGEIKLSITEAKTSDYAYPGSTDFKRLTDMQGIRQTVRVQETTVFKESIIQTRVLFSNEEVKCTYYIYNIGLYATDGTDEVLFCIVTAETPDEMPQYNGVASTSFIYNIQNVVQDATELNYTVNPSGTATIQDVLERVDATGGNISETVIKTLDTVEDKYPVPVAGESVKRFFGKVLTFLINIRPLTGNLTLYVSASTGSDITGDGAFQNPFRTIQHAIDVVPKNLNGYSVAIYLFDGTYDELVNIRGFYSGYFNIQSLSNPATLNTACRVRKMYIYKCSCGVHIQGIYFTQTNEQALTTVGCEEVYVYCCQAVENAIDYIAFEFITTSKVRIISCRTMNHSVGLSCFCSDVFSSSWTADSSCDKYGLFANNGGCITINGNQPTGGIVAQAHDTGGHYIGNNGTQISDDIVTGLSSTWGTIRSGYVRQGNMNGTSIVIINVRIDPTVALTAGNVYKIIGFPPPSIQSHATVAVCVDGASRTTACSLDTTGAINFVPSINVPIGTWGFAMSATYKTCS